MTLLSGRFGLPFLAAGQAQKELTHNEALALIDAVLCPAVESAGLETPPGSPSVGQCWIAGVSPTGAWADAAGARAADDDVELRTHGGLLVGVGKDQ